MKKVAILFLCVLLLQFTACAPSTAMPETTVSATVPVTVPETETVTVTEPVPVTIPTEPETVPTIPEPVVSLTEEEKTMLLKLGMAERGKEGCTECIALVMCTVLNR